MELYPFSDTSDDVLKYFSDTFFTNQELQRPHNPYDHELREMQAIENGNTEQLQKALDETFPGQIGRLSEDELRHMKNLGIVIATLCSRAAIRGGLPYEISFSLCDAYILKIEKTNDLLALASLFTDCKFHFCRLVAGTNAAKSSSQKKVPHSKITQCKNYILSHLHEKLRVQDIAKTLDTSPTYLADLFRSYEGQTITSFILQEKIKLAQNMLIYSPYTYSEIAAYLGFSSQSHLGTQFKKITGFTLREYKERFRILT